MNVAKDVPTVFSKVKAFVDLLVDEAEPYELAEIVFVLTKYFVRLFFFCHGEYEECWSDKHSSLPYEILVLLDSSVVLYKLRVIVQFFEKRNNFLVGVILVVELFKQVDVINKSAETSLLLHPPSFRIFINSISPLSFYKVLMNVSNPSLLAFPAMCITWLRFQ